MTGRFDNVRDDGCFLVAAVWLVGIFANSGVIANSLIILGADILIAGLLALKVEVVAHDHKRVKEVRHPAKNF